jgi:hypothetical protein
METCNCKRCEIRYEIQAAQQDPTLRAYERQVLLEDLRSDLASSKPCPQSSKKIK